jgi:hypothetical protein
MTAEIASIPQPAPQPSADGASQILDLARWAPSGDNTQPWRFEIRSPSQIVVHGYDTRTSCVYDLDACASQISHGVLLETLAIAASRFGQRAQLRDIREPAPGHVTYHIDLLARSGVAADPLADAIVPRTVQRRPMRMTRLSADQRSALEQAVHPLEVVWLETPAARWRAAALNMRNARIRMTIPEAYAVHASVIAFGTATSDDRMPDASLGAPAPLVAMMRWAMKSWQRVDRVNRYSGTLVPRLVLDFIPGLFCSAHFALLAASPLRGISDRVAVGRGVQRFWLTATRLGLQMQPSYTPLLFARYAREGRHFSRVDAAMRSAHEIADRLADLIGAREAERAVWMGRIGRARDVSGRSLRLPLARLIVNGDEAASRHALPASPTSS